MIHIRTLAMLFFMAIVAIASPITEPSLLEDGIGLDPNPFIGANIFPIVSSTWKVGYEDQRQPSHEGPNPNALGDYNDWVALFIFDPLKHLIVIPLGGLTCCPAQMSWIVGEEMAKVYADSPGIHDVSGTEQFWVKRIDPWNPVPEPASMVVVGMGLVVVAGIKGRRK